MKNKKIHHINDRTMKYKSLILNRYQHYYLRLPGTYEARYPQEIVFPNMSAGRADEFYSTKEGYMISLEEESDNINTDILKKISNYVIFADFMYSKKPYSAIICHKDPGKYFDYYQRSPSIIIKVHYIYIPQNDLWKRYENLIKKIEQKDELTIEESLDMVFIPKFISKEYGQFICESLVKLYKHTRINNKIPKINIGVLLGAMILKHFEKEEKINELLEEINMNQISDEIKIIAREEYKDELEKVEQEKLKIQLENTEVKRENTEVKKENNVLTNENKKYKQGIKELRKIKDLTPEAKKIINSLITP